MVGAWVFVPGMVDLGVFAGRRKRERYSCRAALPCGGSVVWPVSAAHVALLGVTGTKKTRYPELRGLRWSEPCRNLRAGRNQISQTADREAA
jgi:hypothetical protein